METLAARYPSVGWNRNILKRTIFYSWQSDLPNNTNLSFIENCIAVAIKKLKAIEPISIGLNLDKATREVSGTPDITESIFNKISRSSVFIADISIINSSIQDGRKTPNPNVLIELGYAARTLGWEKIICVYNTDYGSYEDLPFDLRNRRIMSYSLKDTNKADTKKNTAKKIEKAIQEMHENGILTDKILDFLKKEIDQEILGLVSHFVQFVSKSDAKLDLFGNIQNFLNYTQSDISEILVNKKVLGFYLLKSFHEYEGKIQNFINQAMSSQYYNREILNALIDIYEWFSAYDTTRTRYFSKLLIKLEEKEESLFVINSSKVAHGNQFPDRYLLMKKINEKEGQVCNFGDFYPGNIASLTNYHHFNKEYLDKFSNILQLLIKSINKWIELTNKELIIDFVKNFRVKKTDGDWL
ncbi:hypothetical protein [Desulfobacula phenolica]|uniref:hypothetical protein n=1 Tax=Desulfobacula phenolica TaxID=90732 RepID=UPI001C316363|nr:hypothetical protein [Desulfobacula phenolica]